MMLKWVGVLLLVILISACDQASHYYAMSDGQQYGYETALTDEDRGNGIASAPLLMYQFAGQREGVYQLFRPQDDGSFEVVECEAPCAFLKVKTYVSGSGFVHDQVLKAGTDTVGYMVTQDAMGGYLVPFIDEIEGKQFNIWFENKPEPTVIPIATKSM